MGPSSPIPEVRKKELKASFVSVFVRSSLFVLALVAFGFGMSRFFGWVAFDHRDARELFAQVLDGRTEVRRMAASEWVHQLQQSPNDLETLRPTTDEIKSLGPEFVRSAECKRHDVPLMSSIATLFGYAADAATARATLKSFLRELKADDCLEARVMSLVSLTRLGLSGAEDLDLTVAAAHDTDPSVRKVAAFALGAFVGSGSDAALREKSQSELTALLSDATDDVRWNAAIALSKTSSTRELPVLKDLLERAQNAPAGLSGDELQLFGEAFRAALRTHDADLKNRLAVIAHGHPNLKLRQVAKEIVQKD